MRLSKIRRSGFTLIELLVVMAVMAVLISLLLPAVQSSREAARRIDCGNRLHQFALALHSYHEMSGRFPAGSYVMGPSLKQMPGWGWGTAILPQIEQGPLYHQIDIHVGTMVGQNAAVISRPFPLWQCPSDPAGGTMSIQPIGRPAAVISSGNYVGVEGLLFEMSSTRMADITDGASQTLLLGERVVQPSQNGGLPHTSGWFGQMAYVDGYEYRSVPHVTAFHKHPINESMSDPAYFSSRHPGAANFAFADGSVRILSASLDSFTLEQLGTPHGGEVVGEF